MFELHNQLAADTVELGDLPLCRVLLMNDSQYPWLILVPRREGLRELYELSEQDRQQFVLESDLVSRILTTVFAAEKLNVAALGNMVPQLHVHHIARYRADVAWPKPVWGQFPAKPYSDEALQSRCEQLVKALSAAPDFCPKTNAWPLSDAGRKFE